MLRFPACCNTCFPRLTNFRRLRLSAARAYISRVAEAQSDEEADSSEDECAVTGARSHDAIAEKLRQDAMQSLGQLHRKLAHRVQLPELQDECEASTSGRMMRGHR